MKTSEEMKAAFEKDLLDLLRKYGKGTELSVEETTEFWATSYHLTLSIDAVYDEDFNKVEDYHEIELDNYYSV